MTEEDSHPLAHVVHYVLLFGVSASAVCMVIGIPMAVYDRQVQAGPAQPSSRAVESAEAASDGETILRCGLLILMSTPIIRVLVLAVGWGLQRDFRLMAVALSVLVLLALSIVLSVRA